MKKQRYQVKRKASTLPKGLPYKKARTETGGGALHINPFENARASTSKSPKFLVHNRLSSTTTTCQKQNNNHPPSSALARAIQSRQEGLKETLRLEKKAGTFIDRRIGETTTTAYSHNSKSMMTQEERMLARVVRERVSRSKRSSKYQLDDDHDDGDHNLHTHGEFLTHKGETLLDRGQLSKSVLDDVDTFLSSDDEGHNTSHGQLDKVDTEMHFGGGIFDSKRKAQMNPYGPMDSNLDKNLGEVYRSRKQELDDFIAMKKREKLLKIQRKEQQEEKFEEMDEHFHELAHLLQFRDKEADRRQKAEARKNKSILISEEDQEMDEWDKEMKEYLFERKVKAIDRTKTPEEIAKEKADKLQMLESRRLARMNQEFDNDNLSDISGDQDDEESDDDENNDHRSRLRKDKTANMKKKKSLISSMSNPEALDSDDDRSSLDVDVRFSGHDGLVYTDKRGNIIKKTADSWNSNSDDEEEEDDGDDDNDEDDNGSDHSEEENGKDDKDCDEEKEEEEEEDDEGYEEEDRIRSDNLDSDSDYSARSSQSATIGGTEFVVGMKILVNYRADEQFEKRATWYQGVIRKVYCDKASGNVLYDVDYDDGDFEEAVRRENVKRMKLEKGERKEETGLMTDQEIVHKRRFKAAERARQEIPFTFEIPTTLDALHELIGRYAQSGRDASIIIQRIHDCNSLHLNKANKDKIQNFYDVLLRRFIAVGDALYESGDGGPELERYSQLDVLTKTLYAISQESPDIAGAMWSRRLGIIYNAMAKRLNDSEFISSDEIAHRDAYWPSMGSLLLLRMIPHLFPCTDLRHVVATPALLFMGQCLTHTPIKSRGDLIKGLFLSGLMIECTKDAKRVAPEAFSFIAGTLHLFTANSVNENNIKGQLPNVALASRCLSLSNLRQEAIASCDEIQTEEELDNLQLPLLEQSGIDSRISSLMILVATIRLTEKSLDIYSDQMNDTERELFQRITESLSCFQVKAFSSKISKVVGNFVNDAAARLRATAKTRQPLLKRAKVKASELSIQILAPRLENPSSFSISKDHGKDRRQAEKDRVRREYKREHKAISRELRLDASFIENERRKEKDARDAEARKKRHKNFAWLVQEQATLNQQVAKGGGLLKGGGVGAARAKVASGKIGIKKGGKFR